jgi:hypothetical protein
MIHPSLGAADLRPFSFGNGSQAIDTAGVSFGHFFQTRLEIVE